MGSCCSASQTCVDPILELNKCLTSIMNEVYPGTNFICILNDKCQVVADRMKNVGADVDESKEFVSNVYKLKKSAGDFATAVHQNGTKKAGSGNCQIVHIRAKSISISVVSFRSILSQGRRIRRKHRHLGS